MPRPRKYSSEQGERPVRLVFEHAHDHPSQSATIRSVAEKLGCTVEFLPPVGAPGGAGRPTRPGLTTDEWQRLKELEGESRELKRTNETLRLAHRMIIAVQ